MNTSTCSRLNTSREIRPSSRTPSTNRLLAALKPRRLNMSPAVFDAPPPSPACSVIPGTLRSASLRVVAPWASITARGTTAIVCGISRNGTTYLGDSTVAAARPVTATNSAVRMSSVTPVVENMAVTPVFISIWSTACCGVNDPDTPGDCRSRIDSLVYETVNPVTASNARTTSASGPAGMSKRSAVCDVAAADPCAYTRGTSLPPTAVDAMNAAPSTNRRAVPRRRRRAPARLLLNVLFFIKSAPSKRAMQRDC